MRIGRVTQAVKKGDRVTVYFNNGDSGSFIAQHDITSSKVAVIDNLVFSEENAVPKQSETTRLFKSKGKNLSESDFPWAYLFEINEFEDLSVNYTNPNWDWDDLEGYWRPYGDGSSQFGSQEELIDSFSNKLDSRGQPYYKILQYTNSFTLGGAIFSRDNVADFQLYTGHPPEVTGIFATTDGVYNRRFPVRFSNETFATNQDILRRIDPNRRYWIDEFYFREDWSYAWSNQDLIDESLEDATFPTVRIFRGISSSGDSEGEKGKGFSIIRKTYQSIGNSSFRTLYAYRIISGEVTELTYDASASQVTEYRQLRDEAIAVLDSSSYEAPTFSTIPLQFDGRIFTGQQIIDGEASTVYPFPTGNLDANLIVNGEQWRFSQPGGIVEGRTQFAEGKIYEFALYLIPEIGDRYPGKKDIYCQIENSNRVKLHTIPINELWDGAISPLSSQEVELVIRCGKQRQTNINQNKFDLEWAQTRVYRLNKVGDIISTQIFNNSQTVLNPSSNPEAITIDDRNWQHSWLSTHQDYRTNTYQLRSLSSPFHYWQHVQSTGQRTDLISALRSFYSDRNVEYIKTTRTDIIRVLIDFVSFGTLTPQGFVYLEPDNLYDPNVDLDFSYTFGTRFKPAPNYAILQGLANQSTQNKMYRVNAEFSGGNLVNQIIVELTTNFPKLDLPEGLGDLQAGIKAIAFLD